MRTYQTGRIFANIPTAKLIAFSTGPYMTSLARHLHTTPYCKPKGRVRQHQVMKVDEDCSHHMVVTAPLPIFIGPYVKEHRSIAFGESAFRCYKELNNKEIQCAKCIAYHYYQDGALGVTWLLIVRQRCGSRCESRCLGVWAVPMYRHVARGPVRVYGQRLRPTTDYINA